MSWLVELSIVLMAVSLILSLYRILRGPHLADRAAAFDLLTAITIGITAALSVTMKLSVLFDIAVLVCLVSFLGTVGFAALLSRQEEKS